MKSTDEKVIGEGIGESVGREKLVSKCLDERTDGELFGDTTLDVLVTSVSWGVFGSSVSTIDFILTTQRSSLSLIVKQ